MHQEVKQFAQNQADSLAEVDEKFLIAASSPRPGLSTF